MDKMLLVVDTSALHIKTNIHMLFAIYQRFTINCNKIGDYPSAACAANAR